MSEERPPLRVVISDPRAGDKVIRVKVKGVEDIELKDSMRKSREADRRELPIARVSKKLYDELNLGHVGVMTLRFKSPDGKKVKIPFKVEVKEDLEDYTVEVNMELLGEAAGDLEAEAEAFRAKSWQIAVPEDVHVKLSGLEIGDVFDGSLIGMPGLKLKIRGGTDATGIPMHPGVPGSGRYKVLLAGPPGFHPREKGERRRKSVRGRMVPDPRGERRKTALAQLNVIIQYE
ncbi:MAG: 30S ribosomal protein S6e [Aeropyrum sp.]|nr:30S ribosomal protein S6e [Aeropyrum sp.]MCE4616928.1 30S ribosomal protein S6e [Aeropyrum sp.]